MGLWFRGGGENFVLLPSLEDQLEGSFFLDDKIQMHDNENGVENNKHTIKSKEDKASVIDPDHRDLMSESIGNMDGVDDDVEEQGDLDGDYQGEEL